MTHPPADTLIAGASRALCIGIGGGGDVAGCLAFSGFARGTRTELAFERDAAGAPACAPKA